MRRVFLVAALWLGVGPAVVQSVHAVFHEHEVAHVHEHDGDAHHGDQDAAHESLMPALEPTLVSTAPRLERATTLDLTFAPAVSPVRDEAVSSVLDHGPPCAPPGRLASAVPSNRAPPA